MSESAGSGLLGATAGVVETLTRWGLKLSSLPAWGVRLLPDNALFDPLKDAVQATAVFPRAVARAFGEVADEMAGPPEEGDGGQPESPFVGSHRRNDTDVAIVFIHGFGQDSEGTWGKFPDFVARDGRLADWDIYTVGYATNLFLDVAGLWSASPPIAKLALFLDTVTSNPPFDRYKSLALVAHSMGGLVTQRALLDYPELMSRVSHVVTYGTPSGGLRKASFLKLWKRQIRDMVAGGPFIVDLRRRWDESVGEHPPLKLRVVAGDTDEFVPASSSLAPFPDRFRAIVPGNHLTMVNPETEGDLSVLLLIKHLLGEAAPAGPWNAARVAVESRSFQRAIDELWPHRAELDDSTQVLLSLALDSVGRRKDAIAVLEQSGRSDTDQMGTLAGRFKRRWLAERRLDDATKAQELYRRGLKLAEKQADHEQAYYHAINVAFMDLAFARNKKQARLHARSALDHAAQAEEDHWRLATEGEACLMLGRDDEALERYRGALAKQPEPWQVRSMFNQAIAVAGLLGNQDAADRLRALFREQDRGAPRVRAA